MTASSSPRRLPAYALPNHGDRQARERYVHDLFRRVARRYDLLNRLLSLRRDVAWRRAAARALRGPGLRVLDVATGTGDLALEIARRAGPKGEVVGLDFCEDMLVRARAKAARLPWGQRCRFVHGNALALPFPAASFDAATIAFGLRNVVDPEGCLREMARVVRPGGLVLVLEFSQPRWPLFRTLYRWYFHRVLPRVGAWVQGDPDAYRYLPESVEAFGGAEALTALFERAGLREAERRALSGGIAALHVGQT